MGDTPKDIPHSGIEKIEQEPTSGFDIQERLTDWKPCNPTYYVSGSLAGRQLTFLLDSGCATNLLAKRLWEELLAATKTTTLHEAGVARQSDGSKFKLQRAIELPG